MIGLCFYVSWAIEYFDYLIHLEESFHHGVETQIVAKFGRKLGSQRLLCSVDKKIIST